MHKLLSHAQKVKQICDKWGPQRFFARDRRCHKSPGITNSRKHSEYSRYPETHSARPTEDPSRAYFIKFFLKQSALLKTFINEISPRKRRKAYCFSVTNCGQVLARAPSATLKTFRYSMKVSLPCRRTANKSLQLLPIELRLLRPQQPIFLLTGLTRLNYEPSVAYRVFRMWLYLLPPSKAHVYL